MNQPVRNIEHIRGQSPLKYQTHDIIIPAAGMSTRMKALGSKPLVYVKDKRLVEYQIDIINKVFNRKNIFIVSGLDSDRVMNFVGNRAINLENEKYDETNVGRSIAIGLRASQANSVIVIYGDLFFTYNAINHQYKNSSFIVMSNTMSKNEVGCTHNNGILENLYYDLPNKWGQITYFTGNELALLKKVVFNRENNKMFGYEIINKIIDMGGEFKIKIPQNCYIQDIDTAKDLLNVENYINENHSKL